MIKKIFPYILIVLIVVQLLAPFSVGREIKNDLEIQKNTASAEGEWDTLENFKNAFKESTLTNNGSTTNESGTSSVDLHIKIDTGITEGEDASLTWERADYRLEIGILGGNTDQFREKDFVLVFKDSSNANRTGFYDVTSALLSGSCDNCNGETLMNMRTSPSMPVSVESDINIDKLTPVNEGLSKLMAGSEYTVTLYYQAVTGDILTTYTSDDKGEDILGDNDPDYFPITTPITFSTATVEQGFIGSIGAGEVKVNEGVFDGFPECSITRLGKTIGGCIGMGLYHLIFRPSSFLFAKTGQLLDFTVGYSVRDQSYRSSFVVEGWGVVRDFCNMFFIFILLYIAFGTILKLNGVKTKEMIINVVIIGLLINFSLFATQVIIDASNILTRVFYNSQTIQIGPKVNGVVQNETGPSGEIKLSEGIVAKIKPQELIFEASEVGRIPIKGDVGDEQQKTNGGISSGTFILVVLLASTVNIVGLWVFLTCSFIFIIRVVGLWLAMIFAPLAFFSYTIPAMQEWEMVGWKKWWPETLKMAFIGPVFVFFMYLIIKFLETGLGLADASNSWGTNKMDLVLKVFVPFIFIMILLLKAKDITMKMSGKIGESATKAAKIAGGVALGAATGGAAMLGRQTLGRAAANISQSNKFRDWAASHGKFGKIASKAIGGVGAGSFDARGVKVMGKDLSSTGLKVGKNVKTGGFTKSREEKVKKEEEYANKMLDTSDYGMAQLTSGKMSDKKAGSIMEEMQKAGGKHEEFTKDKNGNTLNASAFRAKLVGNFKEARDVADIMNVARRRERAKYLVNKGGWTNAIKANKVRKDINLIKSERERVGLIAALTAATQKPPEGGSGKTTPPTQKTEPEPKVETPTPQK